MNVTGMKMPQAMLLVSLITFPSATITINGNGISFEDRDLLESILARLYPYEANIRYEGPLYKP